MYFAFDLFWGIDVGQKKSSTMERSGGDRRSRQGQVSFWGEGYVPIGWLFILLF